jgi:WD40 repeat protein
MPSNLLLVTPLRGFDGTIGIYPARTAQADENRLAVSRICVDCAAPDCLIFTAYQGLKMTNLKPSHSLFLILLLFTVACSVQEMPERTMAVSVTLQPTGTIQTILSSTPTFSVKANLQNTPSPVALTVTPTPAIVQSCLKPKELEILPENLQIGTLLLYDRQDEKIFIKDLITENRRELNDAQWNQVFGSPDNKGFAYLIRSEGQKYQLAYSLYNVPEIKITPLDMSIFGEWPILSGWINNNTVVFHISGDKPTILLAVDLISGQERTLAPDFPDINWLDGWSWGYWGGRTLYSPDFHYVVFPRLKGSEPHRYILWNMEIQKEIGFMDAGHASIAPQWAPDGKKFAVAYLNSDFYVMNVDGVEKRLTDLEKEYPSYDLKIREWHWSPDSQKIAFWLDLRTGEELVEQRLMVLDIISSVLTDYCRQGDQVQIAPGTLDYTPAPVWSPDGSALLIENREDENRSKLVIIDLNQHVSYQIGEDLYPYDWLIK